MANDQEHVGFVEETESYTNSSDFSSSGVQRYGVVFPRRVVDRTAAEVEIFFKLPSSSTSYFVIYPPIQRGENNKMIHVLPLDSEYQPLVDQKGKYDKEPRLGELEKLWNTAMKQFDDRLVFPLPKRQKSHLSPPGR